VSVLLKLCHDKNVVMISKILRAKSQGSRSGAGYFCGEQNFRIGQKVGRFGLKVGVKFCIKMFTEGKIWGREKSNEL